MPFPAPVLSLLRELSALPYENLSKIVAFHHGSGADFRKVEKALDLAGAWVDRSRETGAGGTCFALTWWLARRMAEAGYPSRYLLADKGRGEAIHCGLRVDWEGRAYLLDPGYMIFDPLPLPAAGLTATLWSSPNEVHLADLPAGAPPPGLRPGGPPLPVRPGRIWRLFTASRGVPSAGAAAVPESAKWRFDFRQAEATEPEFLAAWEASYRFPMMGYPVLNRVKDGTQYYLQKRNLLVRTAEGSEMRKLGREEMLEVLGGTFGIPEALAKEALDIVVRERPGFFGG